MGYLSKKKSIAVAVLAFSVFLVAGCSSTGSKSDENLSSKETEDSTNDNEDNSKNEEILSDNNKSAKGSAESGNDSKVKAISSNNDGKEEGFSEEKIKNYIISGQENKPEAQKVKWSETFLNRVDIKSLHKQYIASGGKEEDLGSFAKYITLNAPILNDWQELFKKDLYNKYGEKVTKLEPLQENLYQAYIKKDGSEVPYVVVSSRTGYFHG